MTKLQNMRVIEIPPFRAVSSGPDTFANLFGEGGFGQWMEAHKHLVKDLLYAAPDFMWHEEDDVDQTVWIFAIRDGVTPEDCAPYALITFEGGIWLVATGEDETVENPSKDLRKTVAGMFKWIEKSKAFERDERPGHRGMCHMVGCGAVEKALGFPQQEVFLPIKIKEKA